MMDSYRVVGHFKPCLEYVGAGEAKPSDVPSHSIMLCCADGVGALEEVERVVKRYEIRCADSPEYIVLSRNDYYRVAAAWSERIRAGVLPRLLPVGCGDGVRLVIAGIADGQMEARGLADVEFLSRG